MQPRGDGGTIDEVRDLLDFIRRMRAEIAAIAPQEISGRQIPNATDELDAVVRATEQATGVFLDAAEELERLAAERTDTAAARLSGIATRIYEASNFQDITGQRIAKVVRALRDIEARLCRMAEVGGAASPAPERRDAADPEPAEEAGLLNGPALPDAASSQEEIDALFAGSG